jgi:hypothetical protein
MDRIGCIGRDGVVCCSRCHRRILGPATTRNCGYQIVSRNARRSSANTRRVLVAGPTNRPDGVPQASPA